VITVGKRWHMPPDLRKQGHGLLVTVGRSLGVLRTVCGLAGTAPNCGHPHTRRRAEDDGPPAPSQGAVCGTYNGTTTVTIKRPALDRPPWNASPVNWEIVGLFVTAAIAFAAATRAQVVVREATEAGVFGHSDAEKAVVAPLRWLFASSLKVFGHGARGKSSELSKHEMKAAGAFTPAAAAVSTFIVLAVSTASKPFA
jgi:hypothetical protein